MQGGVFLAAVCLELIKSKVSNKSKILRVGESECAGAIKKSNMQIREKFGSDAGQFEMHLLILEQIKWIKQNKSKIVFDADQTKGTAVVNDENNIGDLKV